MDFFGLSTKTDYDFIKKRPSALTQFNYAFIPCGANPFCIFANPSLSAFKINN